MGVGHHCAGDRGRESERAREREVRRMRDAGIAECIWHGGRRRRALQSAVPTREHRRRFSNSKCFLEGFLEGAWKGFLKDRVLRKVLRREHLETAPIRCLEGTNTYRCRVRPFSCTLFGCAFWASKYGISPKFRSGGSFDQLHLVVLVKKRLFS